MKEKNMNARHDDPRQSQVGPLSQPLRYTETQIHGLPLWLEMTERVNSVSCEYARSTYISDGAMHELRVHCRELKIQARAGSQDDPNDLRNYMSCRGVGPKTMALVFKATTDCEPPLIMIEAFTILELIKTGFGFMDDTEYEIARLRGHDKISKISEGHTLTKMYSLSWLMTRDDDRRRRKKEDPEYTYTLPKLIEWLGDLVIEMSGYVAYRPYFEAEAWLIECAENRTAKVVGFGVYDELSEYLDPSQKIAVTRALQSSRQLVAITGAAGSGKTTIIAELMRIIQLYSFEGLLCTPTGKASDVLNKRITGRGDWFGGHSMTIHKAYCMFHFGDELPFNIVIVDESSMVDSGHISMLKSMVNCERFKIIFVGDPNQLPPVGGGRPFVDLINDMKIPTFHLDTPHRCTDVEKLKFFHSILKAVNLNPSDYPNHVTEYCDDDMSTALENVVDDMFAARGDNWYMTSIICSLQNKIIDFLNYQSLKKLMGYENPVIEALIKSGRWLQKGAKTRFWDAEFYDYWCHIGAKVIFKSNGKDDNGEPIYNGLTAIVKHVRVDKLGRTSEVELETIGEGSKAETRTLSSDGDYPMSNVSLGYAMTVHKAQGSGYEYCAYVHTNNPHEVNELVYTACTRAIDDYRIYTPEMQSIRIGYQPKRTTLIEKVGGR
jgi:hypothetical protein